jgi:flagellar motility protein MotE (MotC chaperone)
MKNFLLNPHFLLPLAILLGLFTLTTRIADVWGLLASGKLAVHAAQAEDAVPVPKPSPEEQAPTQPQASKDGSAAGAPPSDLDTSPAEMDVLKQLADRREQLEKRSRELDTREALLKVTEQRVAQKIKEMETLRQQVQSLVNQAGGAQQAQLDNLVKIYETMKPEESAKIFETLDMPILLGVIQRMKPARTALVMAKLAPEKAKEITVALTKQDQLPQMK